jgi:hypothetical protein
VGIAAGALAFLLAILFLIGGLVAPFGAQAGAGASILAIALAMAVLTASILAHLLRPGRVTACVATLAGCSTMLVAAVLFAGHSMLLSAGCLEVVAVAAFATVWAVGGLRRSPADSPQSL